MYDETTIKIIKIILSSFHPSRKVYQDAYEHTTIGNLHMHFLLNAGEIGEDEYGRYQVFSLSESGKKYIDTAG